MQATDAQRKSAAEILDKIARSSLARINKEDSRLEQLYRDITTVTPDAILHAIKSGLPPLANVSNKVGYRRIESFFDLTELEKSFKLKWEGEQMLEDRSCRFSGMGTCYQMYFLSARVALDRVYAEYGRVYQYILLSGQPNLTELVDTFQRCCDNFHDNLHKTVLGGSHG